MKATKANYTIKRDTHKIDATGKTVGRLATEIVKFLRGKHKADFTPHVDNGDFVVVSHASELKFTGAKLDQNVYYRHTGYPGGLREKKLSHVFRDNPSEVIERAVFNMLPDNRLRNAMMKRLTVKN